MNKNMLKSFNLFLAIICCIVISKAQDKPDLIIESVHYRWVPAVHIPGTPVRGSDSKGYGKFTLFIKNVGSADYENHLNIMYISYIDHNRLTGEDTKKIYGSMLNPNQCIIRIGEQMPVDIVLSYSPKYGDVIKFELPMDVYNDYKKEHILLDDKDSTNNFFNYKFKGVD